MTASEKLERDFSDMGILWNAFAAQLHGMVEEGKKNDLDQFDLIALETIYKQAATVADQINIMKYALDGRAWFKRSMQPKSTE